MNVEPTDLPSWIDLIQGGGNLALCVSTYFIVRASERLARIEKGLDVLMRALKLRADDAEDSGT